MTTPIIQFFDGTGVDHRRRSLVFILDQDDCWFEQTHDFIQGLFPNRQPSAFNSQSPILTDEDVAAFRQDARLRKAIHLAVSRMCDFLQFDQMEPDWVTPKNHNFLRITRMLHCLRELGSPEDRRHVFDCLRRIYNDHRDVIGKQTFDFWVRAHVGD